VPVSDLIGCVAARVVLALLLLAANVARPSRADAQQAAVQGIVSDAVTARPLAGAGVTLEQAGGLARSAATDRNGFFQVVGLTPGAYQLRIRVAGYSALEETITLSPGQRLTANRGLTLDAQQIEGIQVTGQGPGAVRRELGGQTITARDIARIPTPAGSGDLASYLQTMPGVVSSGDRGGQLFIRGGTPTENLALMDGMLVYQPFHITGFFSAFPEDLVERAQFLPGGFGAKYSGRLASVLDVQMRDGDRNRQVTSASLSPFLAEVRAEGPVPRSGRAGSYVLSVRRSLIEETSPWLLGEEQPLGFESYYLKVSALSRDGGSRCSMTALGSRDRGGLDAQDPLSRVHWTNTLLGGRCAILAGGLFVDVRFGGSGTRSDALTRGASEFSSSADRAFMDGDFSRAIGRARVNFGGFVHAEHTGYDLQEIVVAGARQTDGWTELGVYGEADIPLGRGVRVLPGVSTSMPFPLAVEPRLRASWRPGGLADAELSGAVGLYEQRVAGVSDRRDASSVFVAWTRRPLGARMRAVHAQASWQQSLGAGFSYSVDGYLRRMYDLPVSTWSSIARFAPKLSLAEGHAHGADGRVELRRGPFYGFAGYGYSWTEYASEQESFGTWYGEPLQQFHPPHDRRHQANALASLKLGSYTMAARWEYGSGFPFTQPTGFDEVIDYRTDQGDLPSVTSSFGQTRVLLDRPYNARLPAVHRLDLSAERAVGIGSYELRLQGGVINVYDRTNIFYYDVFTNHRIDQLPVAPYLSVKLQPRFRAER
jgi:hypothetical protein